MAGNKKFGLITGFDIGAQQTQKHSSDYHLWLSPVAIARYALTDTWSTTLRAEYYQDKNGVIINTATPNGFQTSGLSLNFDYTPVKNVAFRIEGRWLNSVDEIFQKQTIKANDNFVIVSSIAISF